eukprot:2649434-Alexandrium_andersonii.AAC.1
MSASLVGSEMCIRDRCMCARGSMQRAGSHGAEQGTPRSVPGSKGGAGSVSYTHLTLPTICSV